MSEVCEENDTQPKNKNFSFPLPTPYSLLPTPYFQDTGSEAAHLSPRGVQGYN